MSLKRKINLHAHTNYSDGSDTILKMATTCKEMDYTCCVITDHDYCFFTDFIRREPIEDPVGKFEEQIKEAELVTAQLNYPVIIGMEISLWFEEALLFGHDAIVEWLKEKQEVCKALSYYQMPSMNFRKKNHALILAHPSLKGIDNLYSIFSGYEITCGGYTFNPTQLRNIKEKIPCVKRFKTIDAHREKDLRYVDREIARDKGIKKKVVSHTSYKIENEIDLIDWIKSNR